MKIGTSIAILHGERQQDNMSLIEKQLTQDVVIGPLTEEQIGEIIVDVLVSTPPGDMMVARDGQLLLPTTIYLWYDKTYHTSIDPNLGLLDSDDDDENE